MYMDTKNCNTVCFYNNTIHIVEMFYDKNCQVYDVFTLLDSVYLYEDTVHIVQKLYYDKINCQKFDA